MPHSCGHRHCPHCQHHESQQWLERQLKKQVPAEYFLLTFTLPAEFRGLAFARQDVIYDLLLRCAWETVRTFSQNDKQLRGTPGAIAVVHTHTRRLDYHPHVHLVMPAAAVDGQCRQWRTKRRQKAKGGYLFNHKALARVFRAKMLSGIAAAGWALPARYPKDWVVDCQSVGSGEKALVYLGRYLYRGVIAEKDIVACDNAQVSFRYRCAKTGKRERRTVPGAPFLWLVAACAVQGFPSGAQLRLSASELQAADRLVAGAVDVRSGSVAGLDQGAGADPVPLLRRGDGDREEADSVGWRRGHAAADCRSGDSLDRVSAPPLAMCRESARRR